MLLLLCVVPYVFFEGRFLNIVLCLITLIWTLLYVYMEKILLFQLSAREIIDTDHQELFQCIKNNSYTSTERKPRVFLYSGNIKCCFVFESKKEWSVVIDRKLINSIDETQISGLVDLIYKFKKSGHAWFITKILGICSLMFNFINWFLTFILRLSPESNTFRVLSLTMLFFIRPIWILLEIVARKKKTFKIDRNFQSVYLQIDHDEDLFYNYLLGRIENISLNKQIINYLEGFSVLKSCEFE